MRAMYGLTARMRDGVLLSSNVYLPEDGVPVPVVLMRTCYSKSNARFERLAGLLCGHGYALVANDVRGRGDSGGEWIPWASEFDDGYDTIEWAAAQPWCNGRVAMLGGSYEGWVQWTAAEQRPPHLVTMITGGSPGNWFRDWPYRYGALQAADYLEWLNRTAERTFQPAFLQHLDWIRDYPDLRTIDTALGRPMPDWQACLDHSAYDAYWQRLAITNYAGMDLPVLHITGYYDACAAGQIHHFQQMLASSPARDRQHLLIGAWNHGQSIHTGDAVAARCLGLNENASIRVSDAWLAWLDCWLKQTPDAKPPAARVRYFSMGAGQWQEAGQWPPQDHNRQAWELLPDGRLAQEGTAQRDVCTFSYDPANPLSPFSSLDTSLVSLEWFPYQTNELEQRGDVLVFTSPPLDAPVEIAGPVLLQLSATSSALDTDFVGILADVDPDGAAVMVSQGILRACCRESLERPALMQPGQVYTLPVHMSDTAHTFRVGHRLRLLVTSSLYPWFHPNPNTGDLYAAAGQPCIAHQQVYCGGENGSRLWLHVRTPEAP